MPGVKSVSYGNWFGGIYIDEKNFFANFAVEPKSYLDLYPEFVLPPDQKAAFLRDRKGCVVGGKAGGPSTAGRSATSITLKGTIFPGPVGIRPAGHLPGARKEHG